MKNSKEYSKRVNKLFRSLKKRYSGVKKIEYEEPLEALIYGIVSENFTLKQTKAALKRFDDYFTDLNDLRVSSTEEIVENLGDDSPDIRETAGKLTALLKAVFNEYNMVSLAHLHKMGKRSAKKILHKLCSKSYFAVNYCMLTSMDAHSIPLTVGMINYLREKELVHPKADDEDIEGFLTRQIASKDAYKFYIYLRRETERSRPKTKTRKKKKTTRKTKSKTKTKKKTKTKRKSKKKSKKRKSSKK